MRKFAAATLAALVVATLPAHADRGGGGQGHSGYGPSAGHHYSHGGHGGYRGHGHSGHHNHSDAWAGLAVVGALAGLAYFAADTPRPVVQERYYAPQPVYRQAPVYVTPPSANNTWYYCQSSGIYYPYTRACPEGWLAVRPY